MRLYVLFFFIPLCIATAQESQPAAVDTVMNCYPPTDTTANPIIGIEDSIAKYQNTSGPMFNLSFYSSLARHAQIGIQAMLMKFENSISYPDETTYAWHPGFLLSPAYVFGGTTMDYSISAGAGAIFPWLAVFVPAVGVRYKMAPSLNATATLRGFFSYRDSSTTASKIVASPFVFSVGIQLNR